MVMEKVVALYPIEDGMGSPDDGGNDDSFEGEATERAGQSFMLRCYSSY
jgi:hypothetical protein